MCTYMYGSKCNLPNSVMWFTKHHLKNYGYKRNIVTKIPLSADLVVLHILIQCRNYNTEVHAYKKIEIDQCVTILEMVVFW